VIGENSSNVLGIVNSLPRVKFCKFEKKLEDSVDNFAGRAKKVTMESLNYKQ